MKTLVCLVVIFSLVSFQEKKEIGEPTIKALFLYNFTKYVEWPIEKSPSHFIIGFYGPSVITDELKRICENKKIKEKDVEIRLVSDVSEVEKCNMLFIPQNQSDNLKKINQSNLGKGVLIVTEEKGLAAKGASINIIEKDDKIRFEINEASLKNAGLKISSQLMSLAIVIK